MKLFIRRYLLLFVGMAIGFFAALLMGQTALQAQDQPEEEVATPAYGLVSAEFFPANRVQMFEIFTADVEAQLQQGWQCLGAPVIQQPGTSLEPMIIVQTLIKE